jgi:hypothetical protein
MPAGGQDQRRDQGLLRSKDHDFRPGSQCAMHHRRPFGMQDVQLPESFFRPGIGHFRIWLHDAHVFAVDERVFLVERPESPEGSVPGFGTGIAHQFPQGEMSLGIVDGAHGGQTEHAEGSFFTNRVRECGNRFRLFEIRQRRRGMEADFARR